MPTAGIHHVLVSHTNYLEERVLIPMQTASDLHDCRRAHHILRLSTGDAAFYSLPKPQHAGGRRLLRCALIVALACGLASFRAFAQQAEVAATGESGLPNAPALGESTSGLADGDTGKKGTAAIAGTVLDPNGSEVQGAHVELATQAGTELRKTETGSNGEFTFAGLAPGTFRVIVTGPGMGKYESPEITLHAGDFRIVSQIVLPVAAATSAVTVIGDKEELSEEQVHIAVQQRVLGVFPNFYSSYDWNAPAMEPKQKFQLALRSMIDPMAFAGAAGVAGAEQYFGVFKGYGTGMEGFSKRYAAAYANDFSGRMFSSAIFPSIFHQDPRYFYRGSGSIRTRALYAISAAVIARGDNGHWQPNYSEIFGNFAAGALSNLYYPASSRGVMLTVGNGLIETAGRAGTNLVREFFLKGLTSKVPSYNNGKPEPVPTVPAIPNTKF